MTKMTGTVGKKETKEGVSAEGSPWTLTKFTVNGKPFSTFNQELAGKVVVGNVAEVDYEFDGKYNKVSDITDTGLRGTPQPVPQALLPKTVEFRTPEQIMRCEAVRAAAEVFRGLGNTLDYDQFLKLCAVCEDFVLNDRKTLQEPKTV